MRLRWYLQGRKSLHRTLRQNGQYRALNTPIQKKTRKPAQGLVVIEPAGALTARSSCAELVLEIVDDREYRSLNLYKACRTLSISSLKAQISKQGTLNPTAADPSIRDPRPIHGLPRTKKNPWDLAVRMASPTSSSRPWEKTCIDSHSEA